MAKRPREENNNGIGNITNCQIGNIRQSIKVAPGIPEELREALVDITKLLQHDFALKQQQEIDKKIADLRDWRNRMRQLALNLAWVSSIITVMLLWHYLHHSNSGLWSKLFYYKQPKSLTSALHSLLVGAVFCFGYVMAMTMAIYMTANRYIKKCYRHRKNFIIDRYSKH